jgi:hypothetical protein
VTYQSNLELLEVPLTWNRPTLPVQMLKYRCGTDSVIIDASHSEKRDVSVAASRHGFSLARLLVAENTEGAAAPPQPRATSSLRGLHFGAQTMTLRIRRPSPAVIIATLALTLATSGTAFAAVTTSENGNQLRAGTMTGTQTSSLVWSAIILRPGWEVATRAPKAAIDADGIVHLKGAVLNVNGTGTTTLGQLPAASVPSVNIATAAHSKRGGPVGIIIQKSTGYIILQSTLGPNMYVGLEGITYAK